MINLVLAVEVGYVVKDIDRADGKLIDVLDELGMEIDLIEDREIKNVDFSDYDLLIVGGKGRLRNGKHLPKDKSVVLLNPGYVKYFGFLENGRVRKSVSSSKVKIKRNGDVVDVYDRVRYKLGGVSIPYYYLPERYKNSDVEIVGGKINKRNRNLGGVVARLGGENKKCFFGANEVKYWTDDARMLFKECVEFVSGNHDVLIDEDYSNSVDGLRIRDVESGDYLLDEVSELMCGEKYKVDFRTKNVGEFIEDVSFLGKLGDFEWTASKEGLSSGMTTTTGSKTITIDFEEGDYELTMRADIERDDNPEDNVRKRSVKVVC